MYGHFETSASEREFDYVRQYEMDEQIALITQPIDAAATPAQQAVLRNDKTVAVESIVDDLINPALSEEVAGYLVATFDAEPSAAIMPKLFTYCLIVQATHNRQPSKEVPLELFNFVYDMTLAAETPMLTRLMESIVLSEKEAEAAEHERLDLEKCYELGDEPNVLSAAFVATANRLMAQSDFDPYIADDLAYISDLHRDDSLIDAIDKHNFTGEVFHNHTAYELAQLLHDSGLLHDLMQSDTPEQAVMRALQDGLIIGDEGLTVAEAFTVGLE